MKELNKYFITAFLFFSIGLVSCKKTEISDIKEYLNYLADPENGLVKEKTVAGVKIKVKYLPEDYLVYNMVKEMSNVKQIYKDSIAKSYQNSVTFMVNIGPAENEEFDITRVDVSNYEEFAKRIEDMAFNAQDWISVEVNKKEYHPDIVRLENINALEKSRNFIVVFNSAKNSENDFRKQDMSLSYDDELFNTGVSKFLFKAEDIKNLPIFKF
jgi:hypothetical protein